MVGNKAKIMQINTVVSYKPEENGTGDWGLGTGDWGLGNIVGR